MNPIRTWSRRIVICLIGGAAIGLVVAIGCALAGQQWPGAPGPPARADWQAIRAETHTAFLDPMNRSARLGGIGYREIYISGQPIRPTVIEPAAESGVAWLRILDIRSGWPFASLRHQNVEVIGDEIVLMPIPWRGARNERGRFIAPTEPLWPGLLSNSLLFALALFGVLYGPDGARRVRCRLREQRGLCPNCAYPAGIREFCTECGSALRRTSGKR